MKRILGLVAATAVLLLSGCAKKAPYDYAAFHESKPASILVPPPVNQSPDVKASHSVLSTATLPLAEAGYYVFPVAVVEETFQQNGLSNANDIRAVSLPKLHQIFGADAVLYLDIVQYGTSYRVIDSETRVTVNARLLDLRNGKALWSGSATASSNENSNNSGAGLLGMVINAAIAQIANTLSDKGFDVGAITNTRLLSAGHDGAILYGPRSPHYASQR
ncbi:DUF799 domain-containing protein [Serratia rhizosphaerae]|uniref:Lipoprotein NMB1124/NMB1162 n=1 Tax=Serratia rhizosphaerae TaxID=2597702 RepID=A0ABX6GIM6_9GAMM|nr:DUF799 domain-containing protein [Serratia rhizosphaerae]MEB6335764.1 DUF799 domain-containing protein [Serratia rhizosphaerae]QHA86106.1 hypothetical protein FO014_03455 [Serratia rhizosphaerae]